MIGRHHTIGRKVASYAFAVALLPLTFVLVLFVWGEIDRYHGRMEVTEFIARHSELVKRRLADPRVYSFVLTHDPNDPSKLLVQFEVEDKATYHLLENDLSDSSKLKFPPNGNTILRSNEALGNDFGAMARGIGLAFEGLIEIGVAMVISVCTFSIALTFLHIIYAPERPDQNVEIAEPELPMMDS